MATTCIGKTAQARMRAVLRQARMAGRYRTDNDLRLTKTKEICSPSRPGYKAVSEAFASSQAPWLPKRP